MNSNTSRIVRRIGASAVLPTLLAGAVALSGVSASAPAATAHGSGVRTTQLNKIDLAASSSNELHWDISSGKSGYGSIITQLRNLNIAETGATRQAITSNGSTVYVDILNNQATGKYTTVEVANGSRSVHLVIRLSDLYVVGYYYFNGNTRMYTPLTENAPTYNDAVADGTWIGAENYNTLANRGNIALRDLTVNTANMEQAVYDLTNPNATTANQARALLRMIVTISEGARFRALATDLANRFGDGGTLTLTQTYEELIRNWAGLSHVLVSHVNAPNSTASVTLSTWGTYNTAQEAAKLLMSALNDGSNPNPHDEL
ncbi:ribosome-inactivating family protein [Streptomyces sp. NPDC051572]|uniref:ribosome-inactivating family protein n=1 Tax=unclassified Streptomyces TaxID=2593676 RepID=UPI00344E1D5F